MELREGDVFTSVCLSERGGWVSLVPGPFQGVVCLVSGPFQRGCVSRGWVSIPWLLTPSGGDHMYGWQVGSTHPSGMLSYVYSILLENLNGQTYVSSGRTCR